eukprot:GILK01009713.1.p1 GENE.GILK01009713.1~~GILK01009713.1.p1  ORF type:complete len:567 (+),score=40.30 GILK01009713.1:50-1750(+)
MLQNGALALSTVCATLLGPCKSRKFLFNEQHVAMPPTLDVECILGSIDCRHPVRELLLQAVKGLRKAAGCGCTSLVVFTVNLLKEMQLLQQQGISAVAIARWMRHGERTCVSLMHQRALSCGSFGQAAVTEGLARFSTECANLAVATAALLGPDVKTWDLSCVLTRPQSGCFPSRVMQGLCLSLSSEDRLSTELLFSTVSCKFTDRWIYSSQGTQRMARQVLCLSGDLTVVGSCHPLHVVSNPSELRDCSHLSNILVHLSRLIAEHHIALICVGGVVHPAIRSFLAATEVVLLSQTHPKDLEAFRNTCWCGMASDLWDVRGSLLGGPVWLEIYESGGNLDQNLALVRTVHSELHLLVRRPLPDSEVVPNDWINTQSISSQSLQTLHPFPITVIISQNTETAAQEKVHFFWSNLYRIRNTLQMPKVLSGAGAWELAVARELDHLASRLDHDHVGPLVYNGISQALRAQVVQAALNMGHSISVVESAIQMWYHTHSTSMQQPNMPSGPLSLLYASVNMDHCDIEVSEPTIFDDLTSRLAVVGRSFGLAQLLTTAQQVSFSQNEFTSGF